MSQGVFAACPAGTAMPKIVETVRLGPQIREEPIPNSIGKISLRKLKPFLKLSLILDNKAQLANAPYVLAENEQRLEGGKNSILYVRGVQNIDEPLYTIYREGRSYCHPITREPLGFEALAIGTAELQTPCESAEFKVLTSDEAVEVGAKLLPGYAAILPPCLDLKPAEATQEGYILSIRDGQDETGKTQVVVLSLGMREGIAEGDILDIYQSNGSVVDPKLTAIIPCKVKLPDSRVGNLFIYQAFEKLSIGYILETKGPVHLLDRVRNP